MFEANLASNLKRLRAHHDLTQEDVAKGAGISRVAYRDLEGGRVKAPKTSTVMGLANVFGVKVDELLRPQPSLQAVRFRSSKRMNNREQILADVDRWLRDFNQVEDVLRDKKPFQLASLRDSLSAFKGDRDHRAIAAAKLARDQLELKSNEPIHNICGLLESAGIKVYPLNAQTDRFFGLSVGESDGGPAIAVNVWEKIAVERWIFSAAHELGHLLLHLGAFNIVNIEEDPDEEQEAHLFAAEFLMPDDAFIKEWSRSTGLGLVDRVLKVKRIFRVSYKTVLMRIHQHEKSSDKTGILSAKRPNIFVRFQMEYKRRNGRGLCMTEEPEALTPETFRSAEPDRMLDSDFAEDRLRSLVRTAVEKQVVSLGRGAEILRIPLESMRELAGSWV